MKPKQLIISAAGYLLIVPVAVVAAHYYFYGQAGGWLAAWVGGSIGYLVSLPLAFKFIPNESEKTYE